MTSNGILEINLTKCPKGTTFKVFIDKKKVAEILGWEEFFPAMDKIAGEHPGLYDPDKLFADMEFVV